MLEAEEYTEKLEYIVQELEKYFIPAEIRGDDAASFIYIEKKSRF